MTNIMDYFKEGGNSDYLVELPPKLAYIDDKEVDNLLETIEIIGNHGLEITTTFKPEIHLRYKSITLTRLVFDLLASTRIKPNETLEACLIGEFSDSGLYHMHGVLYCNSPRLLNSLRRKFHKDIGRTEIKQIHNLPRYMEYIFKGRPERKILQQEVIIFHNSNYTTKNEPKTYSG